MTVKVFRIEHPEKGGGLYCNGAAEEYDRVIGADRYSSPSLWNNDRCPTPTHENECFDTSDGSCPDTGLFLFAFVTKKAMLAWAPSFKGRCRLDQLGLVLVTYEVEEAALVKGRFQCAFDNNRARRTHTTPLVTQRERREQC